MPTQRATHRPFLQQFFWNRIKQLNEGVTQLMRTSFLQPEESLSNSRGPPQRMLPQESQCLMRYSAQLFPRVCGHILVRNSPLKTVSTISKKFDIFFTAWRGVFLTKLALTHEERAELIASRGLFLSPILTHGTGLS